MKANATDLPSSAPAPVPGPAEAVTTLYRAHALGLIRLAVVMLGDRAAAEDVVQEAFCGLYRRWHALSDPERRRLRSQGFSQPNQVARRNSSPDKARIIPTARLCSLPHRAHL